MVYEQSKIKKNIVIHIGLHKTGSSFLQKNLLNYKIKNSYVDSKGDLAINLFNYLEKPTIELKNYILTQLNKIEEKNIFITNENIFGHHYNGFIDAKNRFNLLEELFLNPKYIIFFRSPSSLIYSQYLQKLKRIHNIEQNVTFEEYVTLDLKKLFKIDRFIKQNKKNFKTNYKIFNYKKLFKNYIKVKERVLFIEYEKFFKEKNVYILNNFTGLNIKLDFEKKINVSNNQLKYIVFYNQFNIFRLFIKIIQKLCGLLNLILARFTRFKKKKRIDSYKIIYPTLKFLINFTKKKYLKKVEDDHKNLLQYIEKYHSKNYRDFKKLIK